MYLGKEDDMYLCIEDDRYLGKEDDRYLGKEDNMDLVCVLNLCYLNTNKSNEYLRKLIDKCIE